MATYIANVSPWEAELVVRVRAREERAFRELFDRFRSRVHRTALKILREESAAEDALQETFMNVYRGLQHFRGDSRLSTWINRITVNVCLEILRKNRKHEQRTEEDISETTTLADSKVKSPFQRLSESESRELVRQALAVLDPKHGLVVKLHDLEELTIREIAEDLNLPEGTVKSRLFYGRHALKQAVNEKLGNGH